MKYRGNAALMISSPPRETAAPVIIAARGGRKAQSVSLTHRTAMTAPHPDARITAAQARHRDTDEVPAVSAGARAARQIEMLLLYLLINVAPLGVCRHCFAVLQKKLIGKDGGDVCGVCNSL